MIKLYLFIVCGSVLLLPSNSYASLHYRSGTEILTEGSQAIDLRYQTFSKTLSYDEEGADLILSNGESFKVNDITLQYSKGYFLNFEASTFLKYRSVTLESAGSSAVNSGIESLGAEGKYLFWHRKSFKSALGLHLKKALYSNTLYTVTQPPPLDKVALGDDGLEWGLDYLATYYDSFLKYDFKFGYNKPSSTLSSELVYNAELVYNFSSAALFSGIGGISSLKNDPYSSSPINKPIISTGNDRLFNSINREKQYLYAGVQYAFGDFIVGLKGETILSGVSTDKGNTISLNIRWEKLVQPPLVKSVVEKVGMVQDYFADGFVERLSTSKKLIKVNVGSDKNIKVGDSADIYSVDDYGLRMPIATGSVIEVNENACFVRIVKRFKNSTIDVGRLVRFY